MAMTLTAPWLQLARGAKRAPRQFHLSDCVILKPLSEPVVRYSAAAHLRDAAGEVRLISTPSTDLVGLIARSPLGAARIWYWRLNETDRAACTLVVVGAWNDANPSGYRLYTGPDIAFSPKNGWRETTIESLTSEIKRTSR